MAQEIKMRWDSEDQVGDITFINGDFEGEAGLETAVLISLFTDRRAKEDDEVDDLNDKRGWWADQISENADEEDQIGSRLWLLDRQAITNTTLLRVKSFATEALSWMIDDGIAARVDIATEKMSYPDDDKIAMKVDIFKTDGTTETFKFDNLWEGQLNGV